MPALTTALVPGLAISIVPGILLAGFMPQPMPWIIKALALSHIRELLVGNFGGSRYLAWIKSTCRREHREPLVRKGRATFIPHFHRVGVGRLPAGQFDGSRSMGSHAGVCSHRDALDPCPVVCICEVRPSWITAGQNAKGAWLVSGATIKKAGSKSSNSYFDRKRPFRPFTSTSLPPS